MREVLPINRRLIRTLFAALLLWALPGQVLAEKIGYVDALRLIDESPQGQRELQALEAEFADRNRELRGRLELFRDRRADFEKNAVLMTPEEAEKSREELRTMQRDLAREQRDYNEAYDSKRQSSLGQLQKVISEAVIFIAKRDNYDLIVQQADFASDQINITAKVLEELVKRAGE